MKTFKEYMTIMESVEPEKQAKQLLGQLKYLFTTPGISPTGYAVDDIRSKLMSLDVDGLEHLLNNWHYSIDPNSPGGSMQNSQFLIAINTAMNSLQPRQASTSRFGNDEEE